MKMQVVFGLGDGGCQLAERLAHQAGLEPHLVVAHVSLYFSLRGKSGHGIDDYDVDGTRPDELVGNLKSLLAIIRLRYPEVVYIHSELGGIEAVEGMLGVDECRDATQLLGFGDGMNGKRGLTGRLRTIDFDDATPGITAHSEGCIQGKTARGDDFYILNLLVAHAHDGAFSEVFLYLRHGGLKGFELALLVILLCGSAFFFLCHLSLCF